MTPPPGCTLLGQYRGCWYAATPVSADVWRLQGHLWEWYCTRFAWPHTDAGRALSQQEVAA
jgi:hypothetical protein